jgi:hypothetical protein
MKTHEFKEICEVYNLTSSYSNQSFYRGHLFIFNKNQAGIKKAVACFSSKEVRKMSAEDLAGKLMSYRFMNIPIR